ncbi:MFS transporter [Alteribacillus sp. HJP-4]|uniref:MFS transporter n=1 Tax=Alteribacillus sp. HJP-4 TaxID=2775394 RepID=UPI0035CCF580
MRRKFSGYRRYTILFKFIMFAPALGPTLSGLIVDGLTWRWLFFIVIPFAIFSIVFAAIYLKNVSEVTRPKVDVLSILLSTIGFGGIVFGFSSAGESAEGWSSPAVYITLALGFLSLALFVWRQLRVEEPMLDLRAFLSPMFTLTTILLVIMMMSLFSTMIILPLFLQGALALSAYAAGLALLPGGILNGMMSPIAGRLFDRFGPRMLVIPGTAILVFVMWMFTNVSSTTSTITFIVLHSILMIGISLVMMPGQTNGLNQLPRKYYPHGTAILNTLQQVAGAIGVALFISIMSAGQAGYLRGLENPENPVNQAEALTAGVQSAFTGGLVFAIAAFILSLFIKKSVSPDDAFQHSS